jgi:hypothetical protein
MELSDMGIGSEKFERMPDGIVRMYGGENGKAPGARPMGRSGILEIFRRSL